MDKISEFFKELKDRISNPLIFSFMFGWLAINWKIVIGLFFYSIPQLQKDGYSSYQNLIIVESNFCRSFLWPFLIALGYTFLFPIIRNLIHIFNAWNQKWGTKKTLEISKEGMISVSKYVQLRETYEKRRAVIEEVLRKESEFVEENETLKSDLSIAREKVRTLEKEAQNLLNINDVALLMEGDWIIKIGDAHENTRVIINKGKIFLNTGYQKDRHLYNINHLAYNTKTQEYIIVFSRIIEANKEFTEVFIPEHNNFNVLRNKNNKGHIMLMRKDT